MRLKFSAVNCCPTNSCENKLKAGLVATIGNFDGVHLGHQSLLSAVEQEAKTRDISSALITFSPHPSKILRGQAPRRLSKFRQIADLVKKKNINQLIVLRFTEQLSQLEPEEFIDRILINEFDIKHLILGPFARIGKNRKGNTEWIINYLNQKGLSASVIEPASFSSNRISSSSIRNAISIGELDSATQQLGRFFSISSKVVHGDGRGRELGFPTANLQISDYVKPPYGVYICKANLGKERYNSVVNFGVRPTFDGLREVLEAYLFDYNGPSFYGNRLELEFIKKLRDEMRFDSKESLISQIQLDIAVARRILEKEYSH